MYYCVTHTFIVAYVASHNVQRCNILAHNYTHREVIIVAVAAVVLHLI